MNLPSIPLSFFLIPYALFVGLDLFFLFFNIHHLRHYGIKGVHAHIIALFFSIGTVIILGASGILLSRFDWSATIDPNTLVDTLTSTKIISPL